MTEASARPGSDNDCPNPSDFIVIYPGLTVRVNAWVTTRSVLPFPKVAVIVR